MACVVSSMSYIKAKSQPSADFSFQNLEQPVLSFLNYTWQGDHQLLIFHLKPFLLLNRNKDILSPIPLAKTSERSLINGLQQQQEIMRVYFTRTSGLYLVFPSWDHDKSILSQNDRSPQGTAFCSPNRQSAHSTKLQLSCLQMRVPVTVVQWREDRKQNLLLTISRV